MRTDGLPGPRRTGARWLYSLARRLARLSLRIFLRRIEQTGFEKVPAGRPVLFAANHPNEMLDPFMLGYFYPGRVNFLGKSTLFSFPPFGWLLRSVGCIPVYRQRDAAEQMGKNEESFRECHVALAAGEAIGIFPEGTSHSEPSLLPLKTGAARIVLGAEAAHDFQLGAVVVPVGLNFMDRETFRSDAVAVFGQPIEVCRFAERYRTDPVAAARELTAEMERSLRDITLNLRAKDEELFVEQLKRIFRHELPGYVSGQGPAEEFKLARALADAYYQTLEREPERVQSLRRRIQAYFRLLRTGRLRPGAADVTAPGALAYLAWTLPAGLLGLPVALHGAFHNWIAYRLPGWITDWLDAEAVERATFKVAVGMVSFPVMYALQTALVWHFLGGAVAAAYLVSLPVTGLFALGYFESAATFFLGVRSFFTFLGNLDFTERLNEMRREIRAELSALADRYLAETTPRSL